MEIDHTAQTLNQGTFVVWTKLKLFQTCLLSFNNKLDVYRRRYIHMHTLPTHIYTNIYIQDIYIINFSLLGKRCNLRIMECNILFLFQHVYFSIISPFFKIRNYWVLYVHVQFVFIEFLNSDLSSISSSFSFKLFPIPLGFFQPVYFPLLRVMIN